ncbi:MAG: tRNA (5-methylaminomethyl-2-thiouridine)(34)-methyltransferase MnmD, partial [Burkholderiales bacterium]|nr:tRNA (5-methylaminomethyl-2-thiouridine)(34)-methyltransferase MnmD [Burkholderiales bacterium]
MQDPIDWSDPLHPRSTRYGDLFASRAGALAQAEAVFLRGNGLPERWQRRPRFTVLETGFGLGNNFLATFDAWRRDPQRCERLFFLSLDAHPVSPEDLARAHAHSPLAPWAQALQAQWPPRVPGWHRLDFEGGRVQLLLAFGDILEVLPQWQAEVDAFFLDGFAPRLNPAMWSERALAPLARLAGPGATAATWSVAADVHRALRAAGFAPAKQPGFGGKGQMTVAHFVPRHRPTPPVGLRPLAARAQEAVVLGAGLAGAACARALHQAGLSVRVFDALHGPAQATSGNPAGLFHATVHADDGPHARWSRAAALRCRQWLKNCPPPWLQDGLLRLGEGGRLERERLAARLDLDPLLAEPRDEGWFYPGGGALPPGEWVRRLLGELPLHTHCAVDALRALPEGRWQLLDNAGHTLAETDLLVMAAGAGLPALLHKLEADDPTLHDLAAHLQVQRGQISCWVPPHQGPALPVASGGYALSLPHAAGGGLLAGATATLNDPDPSLREVDHAHNRAVAERLLG